MPEIHNGRKEKAITAGTVNNTIAQIQEKILAAVARAGRFEPITLVAVTKTLPIDVIDTALAAGIREIGENYVQEARPKVEQIGLKARWHLLGHLQRNKVKDALELFDVIQSVDSLTLARRINDLAGQRGKTQDILLQVHLGDEASKFGISPQETMDVAAATAVLPYVNLRGLMGIAPGGENPRPFFRQLRQSYEQLPAPNRQILSMGMSGDFEIAIEEGATLIRLGTAIFGPRPNPK